MTPSAVWDHEMHDLDIRGVQIRTGAREQQSLGDDGAERTCAVLQVLLDLLRPGASAGGLKSPGSEGKRHDEVVCQVLAHFRCVYQDRDAVFGQMIGRAYAGKHQHVRAADCAGRQDHFALGPDPMNASPGLELHPVGPGTGEQDPANQAACQHGQVPPVPRRREVAVCRPCGLPGPGRTPLAVPPPAHDQPGRTR